MYNSAVIGLGNIGFLFSLEKERTGTWSHADAYSKCESTRLVGAVDPDIGKVKVFSKHFPDVPVYSHLEDLFASQTVDIVSVAVPTSYHHQVLSDIIKHPVRAIFCEKPLSFDVSESKQMVLLAQEKGIVLAVNYTRRWQSTYQFVADLVKSGYIGDLKAVNALYPAQIYIIGSHLFDTILMCTNIKPQIVSAIRLTDETDPTHSGWIRDTNGVVITFNATGKRENLIFEIDIIGNEGRIRILENGEKVECFKYTASTHYNGYRDLIQEDFRHPEKNDRFLDAVNDIVQVLDGKKECVESTGSSALAVDLLINDIITSGNNNGSITRDL